MFKPKIIQIRREIIPIVLSMAALLLFFYALWLGISDFDYRWRWKRALRYVAQYKNEEWIIGPLLDGLLMTIKISLYGIIIAVVIGILTAMARLSTFPSLRLLALFYTQFIRVTPLLVQLYLLYFMFSSVIGLGRFASGVTALAIFEGAFIAEIFRSGVMNFPQSQMDAARSVGLNRWQCWRWVVIPQSLPLILPPLANVLVNLIKHSSIVTIIAVSDLTDVARNLISQTFLALEIWLIVGGMYVVICFSLAWGIKRWEARLIRRLKK